MCVELRKFGVKQKRAFLLLFAVIKLKVSQSNIDEYKN